MTWRIRDRATFASLRQARRHRRGPLSVAVLQGASTDPPRVAYAIGKHVGGAVVRNRLRRRLRAAVGHNRHRLLPGHAYLVGAAPGAVSVPYPELEGALAALLVAAERT
ncbi:MAG: ribonuclease P protein component [Acidimicrobiia bacterium]